MDDSRGFLGTLGAGLLIMLLMLLGLTHLAHAEDSYDIRGTRHGCVDFTVGGSWTTYTSASLENMQGSTALAASLYWTELFVKDTSAVVYICEAAAASCGADTTNKPSVATAGSIVLPMRGLAVQSVALQGAGIGVTGQLCGYFRTSP